MVMVWTYYLNIFLQNEKGTLTDISTENCLKNTP